MVESTILLIFAAHIKLFAERLCRLIEDEELRKQFSKASIEKANTYDVDIIMNKWKVLFEQALNNS